MLQANEEQQSSGGGGLSLTLDDLESGSAQADDTPSDGRIILDDIDWDLVSEQHGTRSAAQCLTKWYTQLAPSMVTKGEHIGSRWSQTKCWQLPSLKNAVATSFRPISSSGLDCLSTYQLANYLELSFCCGDNPIPSSTPPPSLPLGLSCTPHIQTSIGELS